MPITLHLVRHAQGFHNLSMENEKLPDPDLTDLGNQQCARVRAKFHAHDNLTILAASPMRRTLYTCLQSFGPSDDDDFTRTALLPVIAIPELQEVSDNPCDVGSDLARIEAEFRGKVDFSRVPANWNDKTSPDSPWEPVHAKLEARAQKARVALREMAKKTGKEDVHIAAVTHGGFLHFLTEDFSGVQIPERSTSWENCEYRSYHFVDSTGEDPNASIRETEESWRGRLGDIKVPTVEEQAELKRTYYRELGPWMKVATAPKH